MVTTERKCRGHADPEHEAVAILESVADVGKHAVIKIRFYRLRHCIFIVSGDGSGIPSVRANAEVSADTDLEFAGMFAENGVNLEGHPKSEMVFVYPVVEESTACTERKSDTVSEGSMRSKARVEADAGDI